jgi:ABC-type branched-subunit amino acid transport system ATPase component
MDDFDRSLQDFQIAAQAQRSATDWLDAFEAALASRDAAQSGIVVVIAEQMAALALKVSRQALVLRRGSVVMAGTGEELLRRKDGNALAASYL